MDVLEQDKEFTPAMLALSALFMLQDQEQKARNILKRVVKMPYAHDQGEAFEAAYLALAASYMEKAKFDLAQVLFSPQVGFPARACVPDFFVKPSQFLASRPCFSGRRVIAVLCPFLTC